MASFTIVNLTPDIIIDRVVGAIGSGNALYNKDLSEYEIDIVIKSGLSIISSNVKLGEQGIQGIQGIQGLTGPSPWAEAIAWQENKSYSKSAPANVVYYNSGLYLCIVDHTSTTMFDGTKWILVALQGIQGIQGIQGLRGLTGATGPSPWTLLADWSANTAYTNVAPASLVKYNDKIYVCIVAHTSTSTFDTSKFILALESVQGPPGVGAWAPLVPWSSNTNYTNIPPASTVYYQGSSYVCKTAHTSATSFDISKFQIIVLKGDSGGKGDTGAVGPPAWASTVNWTENTDYTNIAPASTVYYNGSSYLCVVAHRSTSSFDSTKFQIIAAQGAPGSDAQSNPQDILDVEYIALTT